MKRPPTPARTPGPWASPVLVTLILAILAALSIAPGCSAQTARRDEPLAGPLQLVDRQVELGQLVFNAHCHQCHPGGAAGLAPSINDKPLPRWLIRTQVRTGLGDMPAFSHEVISDEQLEALVEYLQELRGHDARLAER